MRGIGHLAVSLLLDVGNPCCSVDHEDSSSLVIQFRAIEGCLLNSGLVTASASSRRN